MGRKLALVFLIAFASLVAARATSASRTSARVVSVAGGIAVRLPAGWHVVHRRLTDVVDPIPRLALATFPVHLGRHPCVCDTPNIRPLPRAGAFILVWEVADVSPRQLKRFQARPSSFNVVQGNPHWFECAGPSWTNVFHTAGRVFQVEVTLGPAVGRAARARIGAILDSLTVARSMDRVR